MATETLEARPQLRSDLVIEKQGEGKTLRYLIIDPASRRYFQCGELQYALLALFTGKFTHAEILTRYSEQTHIRLRAEQFDAALRKLEELQFLVHNDGANAVPSISSQRRAQWRLSKRWKLFPVQPTLLSLEAHTRWCFTPPFLASCFLLALATSWIVIQGGWSQGMVPVLGGLYAHPSLLIWGPFILVLLITAIIHESAHALALQHFGRKPGFFGIGVVFPVGIFVYTEISEVWRLAERRQRIIVTLAGPLASLIVGAAGALVWWVMPFNLTWSPWFAALMTAGVSTALFNLVPFFRTDGYFVLTDWLGMPNLDRKARAYLLQTLLRPFRRQRSPSQKLSISQHFLLGGYGVSTLLLTIWLAWVVGGFLLQIIVPLVWPVFHLL